MQILPKAKGFKILPQPNDETCGPTCLQAVYNYFDDSVELDDVITEVKQLQDGGTLAVMLGNHALRRGYTAIIYTYNLHLFDPSWFDGETDLIEKLEEQRAEKPSEKLHQATDAYVEFLKRGGQIRFAELNSRLLKDYIDKGLPILTGLSATYLYRTAREIGAVNTYDDIKGEPSGHFVILYGHDARAERVLVADPLSDNPLSDQHYSVSTQRLINAILLGIVTYDANLLVIEPV